MATAPQDYSLSTSSVTFGPGQTTRTVTVSIVSDAVLENMENFSVAIIGQDRVEGGQRAPVSLTNDDSETSV